MKNQIIFILSILMLLAGIVLEFIDHGLIAKVLIVLGALLTIFQSISHKKDAVQDCARLEKEVAEMENNSKETEKRVDSLKDRIRNIENLNLISQQHQEQIQTAKTKEELATNFITAICDDLKASKGAFFLAKDEVLEFSAGFACKFEGDEVMKFEIGDGLIGQAAMNKAPINLTDIPDDYIEINSGLGNAKPKNVVLFPIIYNDKVLGVFELATFLTLSDAEMTLLSLISNNIATKLSSL